MKKRMGEDKRRGRNNKEKWDNLLKMSKRIKYLLLSIKIFVIIIMRIINNKQRKGFFTMVDLRKKRHSAYLSISQ